MSFGGKFRFKEKLSGRFADILSAQYAASALLWRWNSGNLPPSEERAIKWGLYYNINKIQKSFEDLILNMDIPWFALFKKPIYFLARVNSLGPAPSDKLSDKLAQSLLEDSSLFKNLTRHFHSAKDPEDSLNKLEKAWQLLKQTEPAREKIKQALQKKLTKQTLNELIVSAKKQGILSEQEAAQIELSEKARTAAIQVDVFSEEEYFKSWP